MNEEKKIIVITGGHLTPALATIEELEKRKWRVIFIGRKYAAEGDKTPSVEWKVIRERGIPFFSLTTGRIRRYLNIWTIISFLKIPIGFIQAFVYLKRIKPRVVLSFGGYISVPVVFSAWLLKIPVITHEQTTVIGLATKFNSLFAQKIALSWPKTYKEFSSPKVVLTGNPIRRNIFKIDKNFWKSLSFEKGLPIIFVTGGNQGSQVINGAIREIISELLKIANVFHQCGYLKGVNSFDKLKKIQETLPRKIRPRYLIKKYLSTEEMGTILNKADLVISRAGANTITELAALGKPCILIPFPYLYKNEQMRNAEMLVGAGIAEILPQEQLSGKNLLKLIKKMLRNISFYKNNAPRAKSLVDFDAAKRIVDLVEEIIP